MAEFGLAQGESGDNQISEERSNSEESSNYDPFPPGYADDLLDGNES